MRRIDPARVGDFREVLLEAHDRLAELRHFPLIDRRQERLLTKRDAFERARKLVEYPRPQET